jgi:PAS domain S-box-containing protein
MTAWDESRLEELEALRARVAELESERAVAERHSTLYRLLIEHLNVGIFLSSVDGVILECNERIAEIAGEAGPGDVVKRSAANLYVDPNDRKRLVEELATRGHLKNFETRARRKDGSARWVSMSAALADVGPDGTRAVLGMIEDISERKLNDSKIASTEQRYRELYDNMRDAYGRVDMVGRIVEHNRAFSELVGYANEELVELTYQDLTPPEWHEKERRILEEQVLTRGYSDLYEKEYVRKDGQRVPVELLTSLLRAANGAPVGMWAIVRDVSERRRVEQELRSSEARFRVLAEQALLGIAILQDNRIRYVNQAVADMNGYSVEEMRSWRAIDFAKLVHPDDADFAIEQSRKKQHGDPSALPHYAYRLITKGGQVKWAEQYSRTIEFEGRPANFVTIIDVTAGKTAELSLAEEKERLAVTLRSIAEALITTDAERRIVLMNPAAERLSGYTQEAARGLAISEFLKVVSSADAALSDALDSASPTFEQSGTARFRARDGSERQVKYRSVPLRPAQGEPFGMVLVLRDVTDELKLAQGLERAAKLEALGVLAAGIAHDFNNLLGSLYGHLDLARESLERSHPARAHLELGRQAFERAKALTGQMLAFAKGGAPVRSVGSLAEAVRECVAFALSGSAIAAEFELEPGLWAVEFEKNQLAQALDNLVINAKQAMKHGGVLRVRARNQLLGPDDPSALPAGRYVRLSFRDEGEGIPAELLPRIFDPFFTTKPDGTGLGLTTTYAIVQRHEGTLLVESELGKGSTFHLLLPATTQTEQPKPASAERPKSGRGLVLVMDDEAAIRRVLGHMLTRLGYEPILASDGGELLEIARKLGSRQSDTVAVLLDLTVPSGLGGREVVPGLSELLPAVPLVASSGYSDDPIMANPTHFGFARSLRKPFLLDELAELLSELQGGAR